MLNDEIRQNKHKPTDIYNWLEAELVYQDLILLDISSVIT